MAETVRPGGTSTLTGVSLSTAAPLPSCPMVLSPQARTSPLVGAEVTVVPAGSFTDGDGDGGGEGQRGQGRDGSDRRPEAGRGPAARDSPEVGCLGHGGTSFCSGRIRDAEGGQGCLAGRTGERLRSNPSLPEVLASRMRVATPLF